MQTTAIGTVAKSLPQNVVILLTLLIPKRYIPYTDFWKEFGRHLGNLIKAILFAYAPQAIVLGGGIVSAFPFFKNAMEQTMQSFPYKIISDNVRVVASHQKDSSLLGAAALLE